MTFGLNALYGRHKGRNGVWGGAWNPSNARNFIEYTVSKGHQIDSWEFGITTYLLNNLFLSLDRPNPFFFTSSKTLPDYQVMS